MLDRSAILEDYKRLRATGTRLNLELHDMLRPGDVQTAGRRLGLVRGNVLTLDTEDQIGVVLDYAFHNIWHDGKTVIDRMLLEKPPIPGSPEERILRSLQLSFHTQIQITKTIPGFGVECVKGPNRRPITVVDINFSRSAVPGVAMLSRLHSPGPDWFMTTGCALPITGDNIDLLIDAMRRFVLSYGREPDDYERETIMLRQCIKAGASENIRYAATEGDDSPDISYRQPLPRPLAPMHSQPKVGRNDPCPCGSGKKMKRCCGDSQSSPASHGGGFARRV